MDPAGAVIGGVPLIVGALFPELVGRVTGTPLELLSSLPGEQPATPSVSAIIENRPRKFVRAR